MTTPTLNPAGWYTDPTGRHDSRYWDSARWTAQVADKGVLATEAPVSPAPVGMAGSLPTYPLRQPAAPSVVPAAFAASPPPMGAGYLAVAVPGWRAALLRAATAAAATAFLFEIVVSFALAGNVSGSTFRSQPSESTFRSSAWLFHYVPGYVSFTYPPLFVWPALLAMYVVTAPLLVSRAAALTKAGRRTRFAWSAPGERARLGAALRQLGCSQSLLRVGAARRVQVIVGEIAALLTTLIAGYAVIAKRGMFQSSGRLSAAGYFSIGYGPVVCLIAGILTLVALPLAWPLRSDRQVVVFPDGTLGTGQPIVAPMSSPFATLPPPPPPPVGESPEPPSPVAAPLEGPGPDAPPPEPVAAVPIALPPPYPPPAMLTGQPSRNQRTWLAVVLAIAAVLALVVGLFVWAPWSGNGGSSVPAPGHLAVGTTTTSSITVHWSAPTTGQPPDSYVILRNGRDVATVPGPIRAYRDTGLAPATTYQYRVAAVQGDQRSTPSSVLRARTGTPAVSSARLNGTWDVTSTVTKSGGGNVEVGTTLSDTWKFNPKCKTGPCSVTLSGALGGGEFTAHSFSAKLARSGGVYTGTTTAHITHCGGSAVVDTLTIRVRLLRARVIDGVWAAGGWVGTLVESSPYASAGGSLYCPAQSHTMSLTASR